MEMLCLQKKNYMKMKIRAYSWRTYVEKYDIFKNLVAEIFFLAQSQKFMSVKLQLFCAFLSSRNFPIL